MWVSLHFVEFDELSCRDLSLLGNPFVLLVEPDLVSVVERVVLSSFPDEILSLISSCYQESVFQLEELLLYSLWQIDFVVTWLCYQQEFLVEGSRCRKPNKLEHCVKASVNLFLKGLLSVIND